MLGLGVVDQVGHGLHGKERETMVLRQTSDRRRLHVLRMDPFRLEELEFLRAGRERVAGRDHARFRLQHLEQLGRIARLDPPDAEGVESRQRDPVVMEDERLGAEIDRSHRRPASLESTAGAGIHQEIGLESDG